MTKYILFTTIILLILSCSTNQHVVSDNLLQKRKYKKGWHLNNNALSRSKKNDNAICDVNVKKAKHSDIYSTTTVESCEILLDNIGEIDNDIFSEEANKKKLEENENEFQFTNDKLTIDLGEIIYNLQQKVGKIQFAPSKNMVSIKDSNSISIFLVALIFFLLGMLLLAISILFAEALYFFVILFWLVAFAAIFVSFLCLLVGLVQLI